MTGKRGQIDAKLDGKVMRAVMHERLTALAAEVDRTRQDRGFRDALDAMKRFWWYSPLNQWLIALQRPHATLVAAESVWKSLGRRVKPGERAIGVLAPTRWRRGRGFIEVPVFDVRQTRGRRVPRLDVLARGPSNQLRLLESAAAALGVLVEREALPAGTAGQSLGGRVRLAARLRGQAAVSVLAHELAHEILHQAERARAAGAKRTPPLRTHAEVETEAEATAYVVLGVLGGASKAPTYIGWQGGDGRQIFRSMKRIQHAASEILVAAGVALPTERPRRSARIAGSPNAVRAASMPPAADRPGGAAANREFGATCRVATQEQGRTSDVTQLAI